MNKVFLSGNLTRDVELKYTHSGKAFIRNALAVKRPFSKDKETDFFNLVIRDKLAEICALVDKLEDNRCDPTTQA